MNKGWITISEKETIKKGKLSGGEIKQYTSIVGEYPVERKDIQCFGDENIFKESVMEAKRYKILPHLFFPKHDITIWMDGNIFLKTKEEDAVKIFLGDADIAIFEHPYRGNVYDEFDELRNSHTAPRLKSQWLQNH